MRELKVPIMVGVFIAVVLLGLGARSLYYEKRVVSPLEIAVRDIPGVLSIELVPSGNGLTDVVVTLDADVQLEKVFHSVSDVAETTLGRGYGRLIIDDERTPELSGAYYAIHYLIQEGISTGLYSAMAEGIEEQLASMANIRHRVFVDDQYVFVQLYENDHYLYEVVNRQPLMTAFEGQSRGGRLLW